MSKGKDVVRDSIADLLTENDIDINEDIDSQTLTFNRTPSTVTKSEIITLEQSRQRATKVMETLLKVYLSENFISKSEYKSLKAQTTEYVKTNGNN